MENHNNELTIVEGVKCYIEYLKNSVRMSREKDGIAYATWYGIWIVMIGILVFPAGLVMRGISSMKRAS